MGRRRRSGSDGTLGHDGARCGGASQVPGVAAGERGAVKGMFDTARANFRRYPEARRRLESAEYNPAPGRPATPYLFDALTRTCIVTNDTFNASDGLDFYHTVVSVAYCDFVVLDQKWTRRCRALPLPPGTAQVFSIVELDSFLPALRAWVPPR